MFNNNNIIFKCYKKHMVIKQQKKSKANKSESLYKFCRKIRVMYLKNISKYVMKCNIFRKINKINKIYPIKKYYKKEKSHLLKKK